MPGSIFAADIGFPSFGAGESTEQRLDTVTNYLYMLLEQLRYTLANIGRENINDAAFEDMSEVITHPLAIRVGDAEGNISSLQQWADGLVLSVENGERSSSIRLTSGDITISSETVQFKGMVLFEDLSGSGKTEINGDNITTGTITGRTFRSILGTTGAVSGEIEMCYIDQRLVAGGIRLDDLGAGTSTEARHRMFIYTSNVGSIPFAMKLQSAGSMSIDSGGVLYMNSADRTTVNAPSVLLSGRVDIQGSLYLNGVQITPTPPAAG